MRSGGPCQIDLQRLMKAVRGNLAMLRRGRKGAAVVAALLLVVTGSRPTSTQYRDISQAAAFVPALKAPPSTFRAIALGQPQTSMQMGDSESSSSDLDGAADTYAIPVLGAFAIADAEINVAVPPPSRRRAARSEDPRSVQDGQQRRRKRDRPGFKPVASLGAALGFMAAGPFGAFAGAVTSLGLSTKESAAGDTVRSAAKAAETMGGTVWDVAGKAATAADVEGIIQRGADAVDEGLDEFRRGRK